MPKKQATGLTVVETGEVVRTVRTFDFTDADSTAALQLGIVIGGAIDDRITRAVVSYNMASRLAVEAGYLLLSVKTETEYGDFEARVEAMGLTRQRAAELMRMAKFATLLPEGQRAELLSLPKTKVMALASADPEVLQDLLEEDGGDLSMLGVRELRKRIRELEADKANLSVDGDTLKAERDSLAKQLKRRSQSEEDSGVPIVVLDIRAEAAALVKKAELALTSIYPLGVELAGLRGHDLAGPWVEPSTRLVLAGLVALQVQLAGLVVSYAESIDADIGAEPPAELAHLQPSEVQAVAKEWAELTALHNHEAALRQHDRDAARPRGKGRPASAPQLKA